MEELVCLLQRFHITPTDVGNHMAKRPALSSHNALAAQEYLLCQATNIYLRRCIDIKKRLKRNRLEKIPIQEVKAPPRISSPLQRVMFRALRLHLIDNIGLGDQTLATWRKQCPPKAGFLDLPTEIRLRIYRLLWRKKRAFIHRWQCSGTPEKPGFAFARGFPAALLQVNRRINHEAKLVFYHENVLSFAVDVGIPSGMILDVCVPIQAVNALLALRGHFIHHVRKVEFYLSFNAALEKKELFHWETIGPAFPAIGTGTDKISRKTANDLLCLIEVLQFFKNWRTFTTCWEDCAFWQGFWRCEFETLPDLVVVVSRSGGGIPRREGIYARQEWMEFARKTRGRIIREILRPLAALDTHIVQDIQAKIGPYRLCDYPALHAEFEGYLEDVMRDADEAERLFGSNDDLVLGKRVDRSGDTLMRDTGVDNLEHDFLRRMVKRRRLRYG